MPHQRKRHVQRQPIVERVRLAISDLVANADDVDVEQHSYEWRADDLLVWIRLNTPIAGAALTSFRGQIAEKMRGLLPSGQPLGDWLVVIEHGGETVSRVAWDDGVEEIK